MAKKANMITGIAALTLLFGAGSAFAQDGGTTGTIRQPQGRQQDSTTTQDQTDTTSGTTKSSAEENFAKKAAQGGMSEVKLGQLAEKKGTSPAVKNFARRMVQDHSKANNELNDITSKESILVPNEMDKSDQDTYDRLSKLSGDAFDREYARDMVKDHSKDVSEFQKEAKNGKDESVRNFAAQTLPTMQNHLDQARQMEQAVNQSSTNGSPYGTGDSGYSGNSGNGYPTNNRTNPGTTSGTSPSR